MDSNYNVSKTTKTYTKTQGHNELQGRMKPTIVIRYSPSRKWWIMYLEESNQEPVSHEFRIGTGSILQKCEKSPAKLHSWNQPVHRNKREQVSARQLPNDRPNASHGLKLDKLVTMKVQVLGEACNPSIV